MLPDAGANDKVVVGYVFGPARGIDYRLYTHLCHAFLTAGPDGKVRLPGGTPGLELTAGFTATVNADMKVGELAETITVSGETPVVDLQNVRQ